VFLADGELVALCDSYYPAGLAQGTQIVQDRRIACSFDDLTSRMPRRRRRPRCCFPRAYRSSGCCGRFGTGDVLVEVQDTVAAAGRHEFRYEVSLNGDGGPGPR
jgi:GntR family transcriptional regulator